MSFNIPQKTLELTPYDPTEAKYKVKLDANESPLSLPQAILSRAMERIAQMDINRYPDPAFKTLRSLAAKEFGVADGCITAGNGSDELISVVLNAFCGRGDKVMVLKPDFSMYAFYAEIYELVVADAMKPDGFGICVDEIIAAVRRAQPQVLIFSNPCNPAGQGLARGDVLRLIEALPDTLIIVDEAYMDFWDQSTLPDITAYKNALVLRTMSKAYGMAGIRLGFAIAHPFLIQQIDKVRSPFNVNTLTQVVAEEALRDTTWARERIEYIKECTRQLGSSLKQLSLRWPGLKIIDTNTNFCILKCDKYAIIYNELLKKDICVRCFKAYGFLRITAGSSEENAALIAALEEIMEAI